MRTAFKLALLGVSIYFALRVMFANPDWYTEWFPARGRRHRRGRRVIRKKLRAR